MSIVSVPELHKYMSEPEWSDGQRQIAQGVLDGLEGELEDRLYGAPISARPPITETAWVTAQRGIVMTEYPLNAVTVISGIEVPEGDPLPAPYSIRDGYVRVATSTEMSMLGYPSYPSYPPPRATLAQVTLTYSPGWGPVPALMQAIREKAATVMTFYHDDTMVARATDGQKLPQLPPRTWTDDEVKSLDTYRNLSLVM
jgi:hypothetical protein